MFDLWDGWWADDFDNAGSAMFDRHVWEPTVPVRAAGYAHFVQPVTQMEGDGHGPPLNHSR